MMPSIMEKINKKTGRLVQADDDVLEIEAPEERNIASERAQLRALVRKLPDAQQEVVMLRFADDLDLDEIAQTLDIPLGTVKSRLHNAIAALRETAG